MPWPVSLRSPFVAFASVTFVLAVGGCSSSQDAPAGSRPAAALGERPTTTPATGSATDAAARTSAPGRDLRTLQGRWQDRGPGELHADDPPGEPVRTVKEVSGNRETLTTYAADGSVVYAHAVEFRLEREGRVPVFTFFNREVTAGASKGQKFPEPASYMYRLRGNTWDECWGFLPEHRDRDVLVKRWTRVRDSTAARSNE